jgi:hypothetical protein
LITFLNKSLPCIDTALNLLPLQRKGEGQVESVV